MIEPDRRLRDILEAQQGNSNILRNILRSIGVAILLLDRDLNIRFFTPDIAPFFQVAGIDEAALRDLNCLAPDALLAGDCHEVLRGPHMLDREIELPGGKRFLRRIAPYHRENGEVDGLVISFREMTGLRPVPAEQRQDAARRIARLTPRERQIMQMVVAGQPSKNIATDLRISQRTVENHRANIMRKIEVKSLPALARVAFASGLSDIGEPLAGVKDFFF